MPTYNILGINVYIPDLNEIEQAVINPIESFFVIVQQQIVQSILNGLNFLQSIGSTISSTITQTVIPAISNFFAPVTSFIQSIPAQLSNFGSQINQQLQNFGAAIQSGFNNFVSASQSIINNTVVVPITSIVSQVLAGLSGGFASILSQVQAQGSQFLGFIAQVGNQLRQDFQSIAQGIGGQILQLGQSVGSIAQFTSLAFNQLGVNIQQGFTQFANAAINFGENFVNSIIQFIQKNVVPALNTIGGVIQSGINFATTTIRNLFVGSPSPDPHAALVQILEVAGGVAIGVGSTYATLALIENLNPFSNLRLTETFKKILEIAGIAEIPHFISKLALDLGFERQIRYYFSYNIQPVRPSIQTTKRGLYYQVSGIDRVSEALRYEGYNNEAIALELSTVFQPLPIRMITKFIDNGVIDEPFITRELLKNGLDPQDVPAIVRSLTLLKVSQYQSSAKQIVSNIYKHGYLNDKIATDTLRIVGTPDDQIAIVLYLARLQFQDEQLIEIETSILNEIKKGLISPEDALSFLEQLGLDKARADIKVKLAVIATSPTPTKAERAAIVESFLNIAKVTS